MRITTMQLDPRSSHPAAARARRLAGMRLTPTLASALAVSATLWLAAPCRADLDVSLSFTNTNVSAGSSGTLEVWLTNTGPTSVNVGADSFELTLSGSGDVQFTSASTATSLQPYIYGSESLVNNQPPILQIPFTYASFPNTDFIASDSWDFVDAPGGYATIAGGQTVGLGLIGFSVSSTASLGAYQVGFGPGTTLTDPTPTPLTIDNEIGGTINVGIQIASVVPELPTSIMWMFAAATGPVMWWSRRRKARTTTYKE